MPSTSSTRASSSAGRPDTMATTAYRATRSLSASRAPSTGAASSGLATIAESDPSKSRKTPARSARRRKASAPPRVASRTRLAAVVLADHDGDLDLPGDLRRHPAHVDGRDPRHRLDGRAVEVPPRDVLGVRAVGLVPVVDDRLR